MTQEQQNHNNNASNYRYPGSRPFSDSDLDRRLFFGREKEIQYLFHSILVENLFILFAKSGIGKTSLLNAGVLELLRQKDFVPLVIRFNDPKKSPLDEIYPRIEEAVELRNKKVAKQNKIDYEPGEKETLWQFFKTASFWSSNDKSLTPVIILDQFEEFFNLHPLNEREEFTAQLADLVRNQIPKSLRDAFKAKSNQRFPYSETAPEVKIIISIREDYLGNMEEMTRAIPGILKSRFRLLPLKSEQAKDAIIKPAGLSKDNLVKSQGFSYADATIDKMLDFLCERRERERMVKTDEIEPFQLQLLCQHIEEKVIEKSGKKTRRNGYVVQPGDLGGKAGMKKVLQNFYEDRIKGLDSRWGKIKVRKLCEKGLIDRQYRMSLEQRHIMRKYKVSRDFLTHLVDSRLLRSEPRVGSIYYELSHDTLVQPILKSSRERKKKRARVYVPILVLIVIIASVVFLPQYFKNVKIRNLHKDAVRLVKNMEYESAIDIYKIIIEINPECVVRYLKEIDEFSDRMGDADKAIELCEEAKSIKNNPEIPGTYAALGSIYMNLRKPDTAKEIYYEALNKNIKRADIYKGLAILLISQKEPDEAVKIYRDAVKANDEFAYIYKDIARAMKYENIDNKEAALEKLYQTATAFDSKRALYYETLGRAFFGLKEYDRAIENYKKALSIDPEYFAAYKRLGLSLGEQKQFDEAIKNYEKARKLKPTDISTKANLAEARLIKGNFSEAYSLSNELLQNKKLYSRYKLAMRFIRISSLVFLGKKSEALEQIEEIKQFTSSSRYRDYSSSWRYNLARDFITESKKLKADDKELLLDLIKEIETLGRRSYKR